MRCLLACRQPYTDSGQDAKTGTAVDIGDMCCAAHLLHSTWYLPSQLSSRRSFPLCEPRSAPCFHSIPNACRALLLLLLLLLRFAVHAAGSLANAAGRPAKVSAHLPAAYLRALHGRCVEMQRSTCCCLVMLLLCQPQPYCGELKLSHMEAHCIRATRTCVESDQPNVPALEPVAYGPFAAFSDSFDASKGFAPAIQARLSVASLSGA
jgi:hypothetical protein